MVLVATVVAATVAWPVPGMAAPTNAAQPVEGSPIASAKLRAASVVMPGGTWSWQNPSPNGNALKSIACPTTQSCFAAGDSGPILATTDGGAHWSKQQVVTGVTSLSCGDASFCVGVAAGATEITTSNAGATWTSAPTGLGQFYGVSCIPGTHTCIGVGYGGLIAELTGPAVGQQTSGTTHTLIGISCSTASCVAVGYTGLVLVSGGATGWTQLPSATTALLLTVSCGATLCVAGGVGGVTLTWPVGSTSTPQPSNVGSKVDIYGSSCPQSLCMLAATDGLIHLGHGGAWGPQDIGAPGAIWSIACPSASFCLAAGDGYFIAATTNGGTGWQLSPPPAAHGQFDAISCPTTSMCLAVGFGVVMRTTDAGVTWVDLGISTNIRAISCPSATVCYLVGSQRDNTGALVYKTADGGATWSSQQIAAQPLYAVSCPSLTTCFAGGQLGALFATTNGTTWTSQASGTNYAVTSISCAATTNCMAITQFAQSESILATTDSGSTWSSKLTLTDLLYSIKCPSTTTCYAVGRDTNTNYTIYKTVDGGAMWSHQSIVGSYPNPLLGVDCLSVTNCFAVGQSGDLYGTTDGTNWTAEPGPYGIWYAVSCAASTTTWCYTVDFFGSIARTNNGGSKWLRVFPNGTNDDLKSISCPSTTACFAVAWNGQSGSHGDVLTTTDGGTSWKEVFTQAGAFGDTLLAHITCPTTMVCFATDSLTTSARQYVVKSSDGGATWSSGQVGTTGTLSAIACADATNCFVGDAAGYFTKTADGGATWSPRALVTATGISGLSCPTASRCFATDGAKPGHIYATSDAGAHWSLSFDLAADPSGGSQGSFNAISCPSTSVCSAVGIAGLAATTTDSGLNWRTDNIGSVANLTSVSCPSDDICFAATDDSAILRSNNWGGDWLEQFAGVRLDSRSQFAGISCPTTTGCFAVGAAGLISGTTNGGAAWTREQPVGPVTMVSSISCTDSNNCYAGTFGYVGPAGIHVTHDGGATWSFHTVNKADTVNSVSCPETNTCFGSGWPGAMYFSGDGGTTWTYQSNPFSGSDTTFIAISCPSATTCYAVGSTGKILSTTNGGATWIRESSGTTQNLAGVSCTAAATCVAVGVGGTTVSRTATGWQVHASGTANNLTAVSCPTTTRCFAVGRSGTVLLTNDQGATWTPQASGVTVGLLGIQCTSSTGCLAAGLNGTAIYTLDGASWLSTPVPTSNTIRAVAFLNPGTAWLVGAEGTILHNSNLFFLCLTTALSGDKASPQNLGSTVTFTAANPGGCNHLIQFLLLTPGGTWTVVQTFSPAATWTWNSAGLPAGTYWIGAWSRDAGSPGVAGTPPDTFDSYTSMPFTLQVTPCAGASISGAPISPVLSGAQVTLTASSTACANPLYQFVMRPASQSNWQTVQTYSTSTTYKWNSTGAAPGIVYFGVWAKDAASAAPYDSVASTPYSVTAASCGSVTVSGAPASPQLSGTPVTFTAVAAGCTNPNPLYQFVLRPASQTTWQVIRGYSTSATYKWNSTGAAPGTVYFGVWVKDASSPADYDAVASTAFVVSSVSCASVTISAAPTSVSHGSGTHVILTAAASGCTNTGPLYQFVMRPASSTTWQVVQGYSTSATYDWNSTGAAAGTVYFGVWAKDASSSEPYDTVASTPVTVS